VYKRQVKDEPRIRVFYVVWGNPLMTAGGDSFVSALISLAGGINVFNDTTGWPSVSGEQVLARDPEVIILLPTAGINASQLCDGPFAPTTAVQTGRIYTASDANPYLRPSPRIVEAVDEIARFLHPEAFGLQLNSTVCQAATATG
jgi:iron complex transport system substrate-binding protein